MKKAAFSILILIFGLLEAGLLDSFQLLGVQPNLLLMSAVTASLIFELKWAFVFAIFAGMLNDTLGVGAFGINTLLFCVWVFLIIKLSRKIPLDSKPIRIILVFIIVISHNFLKKFIFFIWGKPSVSISMFLYITFWESLYTAAVSPLLFKLLESVPYPTAIE